MSRKNFSEDTGKETYKKSDNKELSFEDLSTKYVCMASLAGLMAYLDANPNFKVEKDYLNIKFHYSENHLNIPFQSTLDLELLLNSRFNKANGTMFSLFKCQTISGFRLLRSNILQPLTVKEEIKKRYDAVEELYTNQDTLNHIKDFLPAFKNMELYISRFMHRIQDPTEKIIKLILNSIEGIRYCLKAFRNFREIIKVKLQSEVFLNMLKCFNDKIYDNLLERIDSIVEDFDYSDVKIFRKQDSIFFMIKSGINNLLDVSRKTYSDTINDIYLEFERLKSSTNDPNIKLVYGESKGYYVVIGERYYIESDYVLSKKVGRKYNCSNIPLISLSERVKEIKRDLIDISMKLIVDLVNVMQKNINYLFVLSSYIALIDVLCCFADYSRNSIKCTRPAFNTENIFSFILGRSCRHPTLERNPHGLNNNMFVPNDYFFTSQFNILLLKGANASGKTTYMKQIALIVILAQIGCFVPCDYFEFSLRKFIYTKFESNDNMSENKGTYIKEIIEIQKVLTNNLESSLVLLDEPFDNTESIENFALSIAVLDQFASCGKCFVTISSHNTSLSQLSSFYFNIVAATMTVLISDNSLNFLYKLKYDVMCSDGDRREYVDIKERNYGIILADIIGFNEEIIKVSINLSFSMQMKLQSRKSIRF